MRFQAIAVGILLASSLAVTLYPERVRAVSNIDPYVTNFVFDRIANGSNFDYRWTYDICNAGTNAYTQNGWGYYGVAFNTRSGSTTDTGILTSDQDIGAGQCFTTGYTPAVQFWIYNQGPKYCCGQANFITPGGDQSQNDVTNNDQKTYNDHDSVMLASQTVSVRVSVFNWLGSTVSFSNTVEELPTGWIATVEQNSINIEAGGVGYFRIIITSPSSITSWPSFHVWSSNAAHTADQSTTYHVRDAMVYAEDGCADQELL